MENKYLNEQKYLRAQKKVKALKGFYIHLLVFLCVNAFIILVKVLSGEGWSTFVHWDSYKTFFFWGIGLAFHAFGVFGMDILLGKEWENRKIKEIMDKDKSQFWE